MYIVLGQFVWVLELAVVWVWGRFLGPPVFEGFLFGFWGFV